MNSGQKEVAARVNASIICKEVRLIDADGNMVGIVSPEKANIMASEVGLDLVEISPNATPPVCKIMDFGKFKYCLLYTSPSPRDKTVSRMPSSA